MVKNVLKDRRLIFLCLILAMLQLCLLVRRVSSDYSEALYWDEWDARLPMDLPLSDLSWNLLWQQHNEHRLVISKILFFVDFKFFGGSNIPLILFNFAIVGFTIIAVYQVVSLGKNQISNSTVTLMVYIFTLTTFSVLQIENFSWGFQVSFFLSVLIPVISFLYYLKFTSSHLKRHMFLAYFLSLAALGTMASGNFSMVVIFLISIFLRRGLREVALHGILMILFFTLYTYNYESQNSSPFATLLQHPDFVFRYVITYFANPINQLTYLRIPEFTAIFTGIIFLYFARRIYNVMKSRETEELSTFGFMLFLYSILIALVSAGGRYYFGVNQANASRYTTISLLGWFGATLVLLGSRATISKAPKSSWPKLAFVLTLVFLQFQIVNSNSMNDVKSQRNLASIALLQNVQDDSTSIALYPSGQRIAELSQSLIEGKKSIFTQSFIKKYNPRYLSRSRISDKPDCLGFVDNIRESSDGKGYLVEGWTATVLGQSRSLDLLGIDEEGNVVGAGISGFTRLDVAQQLGPWSSKTGFRMVTRAIPKTILALENSRVLCSLKFENKYE